VSGPQIFCRACGAQVDARAEICPRCGVRQPQTYVIPSGKNRAVAIALALLLGGLGIHKFYLGKIAQGVIYLIFFWTYIPALVAWIEAILYLRTSDEAWAATYGGPPQRSDPTAIGCLWALALLPLILAGIGLAMVLLGTATTVTMH
jgi:TM2 domain-containing membrane protein YozV